MNTNIAIDTDSNVTDVTLNACPARVLVFVEGGNHPSIKKKLVPLGWKAGAKEGFQLLASLQDATSADAADDPDPVEEAIARCETWQDTGLVRARAMLQLRFPEQAVFFFHDFTPGTGMAAVMNVASILRRRQQLESSPDRKGTRKVDHEASRVLDASGMTKAVVKELSGLVETAQLVVDDVGDTAAVAAAAAANRNLVLRRMHAWLTAWSDIARTVITRRDELIRLGIAKRRARKTKAAPVAVAPAAPAPVPAPAAPPAPTPIAPPAPSPIASPVNQMAKPAADDIAPESRAA